MPTRPREDEAEFSRTLISLILIVKITQVRDAREQKSTLLCVVWKVLFIFLRIKIGHLVGHHLPPTIQVHIHAGEQSRSSK